MHLAWAVLPDNSSYGLGQEQHLNHVHCPADVHPGGLRLCEGPVRHRCEEGPPARQEAAGLHAGELHVQQRSQ